MRTTVEAAGFVTIVARAVRCAFAALLLVGFLIPSAAQAADPRIVALAASLGNNPATMFAYVRDQIAIDIYGGNLRGARGTLAGKAGNALDRASLLVELLRAAGYTARYATGTLSDPDVARLILGSFSSPRRILGCYNTGAVGSPTFDFTLSVPTKTHYWVEYKPTPPGGFVALDPAFPEAIIGQTYATPTAQFDDIPDNLKHKVRIRLSAEMYSQAGAIYGFPLGTTVVLDQTFAAADLSDHPVTVGHIVTQSTPPGLAISATTNVYSPYLVVGDSAIDPRNYLTIRGTDYTELITNFPLGSTVLTGVFVDIDVIDPALPAQPKTYQRALVDRIGYANRQTGGTITLDPASITDPALSPVDLLTIDVAPGKQAYDDFAARKARLAALNAESAAIKDEVLALPPPPQLTPAQVALQTRAAFLNVATLTALNELAVASFVGSADRSAAGNASVYLVKPWYVSPRLTLARAQASTNSVRLSLDVRKGDLRAYPLPGIAFNNSLQFERMRGLYESSLEGDVLQQMTGVAPSTLPELLKVMADPGQLVPIGPPNQAAIAGLALSADAKARIAAAVGAGKVVLVPPSPVMVNGAPYTAWLESDPNTGYTISVGEDGTHQAIVEYSNLIEFVQKFNEPFARFIGQVNAFGVSSFAFAAALVTGISSGDPFADAYQRTKVIVDDVLKNILKPIQDSFKKLKDKLKLEGAWNILEGLITGLSDGFENQDKIFSAFLGDPPVPSILFTLPAPPLPANTAPGGSPGITISLALDPRFSTTLNGAEFQAVYVAQIHNTGPATDSFRVDPGGISGNSQVVARAPALTLPPGGFGEVNVCILPQGLPAPGTPQGFNATVRSTTNAAINQQGTGTFVTPAASALLMHILPEGVTVTPGSTVNATLTLDSLGNAPTHVTLSAQTSSGLVLSGMPSSQDLVAGESRSIPVSVQVSPTAVPGSALVALLSGDFGAVEPATASITVNVTSALAACTSRAALNANTLGGRPALGANFGRLASAMDALAPAPGDATKLQAVLVELDSLINVQLNASYLTPSVAPLTAARAALAIAAPGAVAGVLAQIDSILCGTADAIAAATRYDFRLALFPQVAINLPAQPTTVNVDIFNDSPLPRVFDVAVSGVPSGTAAAFNTSSITVPANFTTNSCCGSPTLTLTFTNTDGQAREFNYVVTATPRDQPAVARTVTGRLVLRPDVVRIVSIVPTPPFANAGTPISVAMKLMNSINVARNVNVPWEARDKSGIVRRSGTAPGPVPLASGDSIVNVAAVSVDTTGFPSGPYTFVANVYDAAACCTPLPGSITSGFFLIGQPFGARLSVTPSTVPPGDNTVGVALDLTHDSLPTPMIAARSSLALPASALTFARSGQYLYACQSDRISIVDTLNPDAPAIILTFASGLLASGYSNVGCNVNGNTLVLAYSGDTPTSFDKVKIVSFDIGGANATNPVQLNMTPVDLGKSFGSAVSFVGSQGYMPTSIFLYNPFSGFIFQQNGNLLALDFTTPSAPVLAGELFHHFPGPPPDTNDPAYGGPNMYFGIELAGNYVLASTTTSTGGSPDIGVGRVAVVDRTQLPTNCQGAPNPCIVKTIDIPQARLLFGAAKQGNVAIVVGDTLGFYDANRGLTGFLTVTALDISTPSNPTVISTLVTPLLDARPANFCNQSADPGGTSLSALTSNFYAVGAYNPQSCSWTLTLIDANDPANLRVIPYDVTDVLKATLVNGDKLYALTRTGVLIYDYAILTGPAITASVDKPKGPKVTFVPGTFNLAPTTIDTSAPAFDRYTWVQPSVASITWQAQLPAVQPGETRDVALGGHVDFTLPTFGSGSLGINGIAVTSNQIISIAPASQTVGVSLPATYTITLKNAGTAAINYALTVEGVPASWVKTLNTPVLVPAGGQATATLVLATTLADNGWGWDFRVIATAAGGVTGSAQAQMFTDNFNRPIGFDNTGPVYGTSVVPMPNPLTLGRGDSARVLMHTTNVGTANQTYNFFAMTVPPGFGATFERNSVTVGADASADVGVIVAAPAAAAPGPYDITFHVYSFFTDVKPHLTVNVLSEGVGVTISPPSGTPATPFTVQVKNNGVATDTFDLTTLGPLGGVITLAQTFVTLAPGATQNIAATVGSTVYLPPGTSTFSVQAISRANGAARARASAQVSIPGAKAVTIQGLPPVITVPEAPATRTFAVRVQNAGNVEDTYKVSIKSITGPLTAVLRDAGGNATQMVVPVRLPGRALAQFQLDTTLNAGPQGVVTLEIVSQTDGTVVATATATVTIVASTGVQRTFVASTGSDSDPCSVYQPCRSFAQAISKVVPRGEVVVQDSAGYGPVVISQPVSIIAPPGIYAGVTVQSGSGIVVNPGAGKVILRGLTVTALGGAVGVDLQTGDALYLERMTLTGFPTAAIRAQTTSGSAIYIRDSRIRDSGIGASFDPDPLATGPLQVEIDRSQFERNTIGVSFAGNSTRGAVRNSLVNGGSVGIALMPDVSGATASVQVRASTIAKNSGAGASVAPASGATAVLNLFDTLLTDNGIGLDAQANGSAYVNDSTITRNGTGVASSGGSTIVSAGDNRLVNNSTNGSFTSTVGKQ